MWYYHMDTTLSNTKLVMIFCGPQPLPNSGLRQFAIYHISCINGGASIYIHIWWITVAYHHINYSVYIVTMINPPWSWFWDDWTFAIICMYYTSFTCRATISSFWLYRGASLLGKSTAEEIGLETWRGNNAGILDLSSPFLYINTCCWGVFVHKWW